MQPRRHFKFFYKMANIVLRETHVIELLIEFIIENFNQELLRIHITAPKKKYEQFFKIWNIMTTQEKVISMVSWVADVPATRVCPTTNIKEDLNLDSIDVMMLIVKLEKWFDVILSSEEVEAIETVKDASDCISMRMRLAA